MTDMSGADAGVAAQRVVGAGYTPGDRLAMAGPDLWLLADASPADPVVRECWPLVRAGAGLGEVTMALTAAGSAAFAVAHHRDGGVRVVVHGDAWAEIVGVDGHVITLRPEPGTGPAEAASDRPVAAVRLGGTEARPDPPPAVAAASVAAADAVDAAAVVVADPLPLDTGVVRAAVLTTHLAPLHDTAAAPPAGPVRCLEVGLAPLVSAVTCPAGHLNDPAVRDCRVCGAAVPAQSPVRVARPPLGILRLSTGDTVPLDRDVVLGRAPGTPAAGEPHSVTLDSPYNDISRRHVAVRLDGWDVIVVDLESRNGTFVEQPGEAPAELPSGGARVLRPGAVVGLTEEVSFQYEVSP